MYMFDGHNVFFDEDATYGQSWGMADYMDKTDTPLIIAAVECNPVGNNRLEEYCPFTCEDPNLGRIRGRGRATMEWFIRDFKPMIDANLRTLPDRVNTLIAGSSMGGLPVPQPVARPRESAAVHPSGGNLPRYADLHGLRRGGNGQPRIQSLRADHLFLGAAAKGRRSRVPHRPRRHPQRGLVGAADSRFYEMSGVLTRRARIPHEWIRRINPWKFVITKAIPTT